MLNRFIDAALSARWIVLASVLALLVGGGYAIYTMPVEAFPDLTNNQVTVVTDAPSMPPTEVEQLVTYPIEQAMMGMPKQQEVRSHLEARPVDHHGRLRRFRVYVLCAATGQ